MKKEHYNLVVGILVVCLIVLIVLVVVFEKDKPPRLTPEEANLIKFERCVNNSGLILYGRHNSQVFLAQKDELGLFFEKIPFVDCVNQRRECEGILLVPAWKIKEQVYYGSFSKDVLIKLMECE